MRKDKFPSGSCHICEKEIKDIDEGFIVSNDFIIYINKLLSRISYNQHSLINGPNGCLVDAITWQYFQQFRYGTDRAREEDRKIIENMRNDRSANYYRLAKIYEEREDRMVHLLAHKSCIPKDLADDSYCVDLRSVDSPKKAVELMVKLDEEKWDNFRGWRKILEDLFGRKA